jgi:hypothetical protein
MLALAGFIFLLALLFPYLCFQWFSLKANKSRSINNKAYYSYMASLLYLHQLGFKRNRQTPLQLAENKIDPVFHTGLGAFITVYQKIKYSGKPLTEQEVGIITNHYPTFIKAVKQQIPLKKRIIAFLNPANTLEYFTQPNILGTTKKS